MVLRLFIAVARKYSINSGVLTPEWRDRDANFAPHVAKHVARRGIKGTRHAVQYNRRRMCHFAPRIGQVRRDALLRGCNLVFKYIFFLLWTGGSAQKSNNFRVYTAINLQAILTTCCALNEVLCGFFFCARCVCLCLVETLGGAAPIYVIDTPPGMPKVAWQQGLCVRISANWHFQINVVCCK